MSMIFKERLSWKAPLCHCEAGACGACRACGAEGAAEGATEGATEGAKATCITMLILAEALTTLVAIVAS